MTRLTTFAAGTFVRDAGDVKAANTTRNSINVFIGSRLRAKRTSRGISEKELSEKLRIDRKEFHAYEEGEKSINANLLLRIAQLLDVLPDYFFQGYTEKPSNMVDVFVRDLSTLTVEPPFKEPIPIHPIHVSGMAYAKVIDGMMNVAFYLDQPAPDGGSERVIVAKHTFPARPTTVARALVVNRAMLEGAMREQAEWQGTLERERPTARRKSSV